MYNLSVKIRNLFQKTNINKRGKYVGRKRNKGTSRKERIYKSV